MTKSIVAAIDIGSSQISCAIAEIINDRIDIKGIGVVASDGVTKGFVNNISKVADCIAEAVKIAVNRAGVTPVSYCVSVNGASISSLRSSNYVAIQNEDHEIRQADLDRLKEDAKTIQLPIDSHILHILIEDFFIDKLKVEGDPIGCSGNKLEGNYHIIYSVESNIQKTLKAIERAKLKANNLVFAGLASSHAIIDDNLKELGVLVIDIGAGATTAVVYSENSIKLSKVFPIGGNLVTSDLRLTFGLQASEAEAIKIKYGYADVEHIINKQQIIKLPPTGAIAERPVPITQIANIIQHRLSELFVSINNELVANSLKKSISRAGIFITGGGSYMRDIDILAQKVFGIPARLGIPSEEMTNSNSDVEKPELATLVGLLHLAKEETTEVKEEKSRKPEDKPKKIKPSKPAGDPKDKISFRKKLDSLKTAWKEYTDILKKF